MSTENCEFCAISCGDTFVREVYRDLYVIAFIPLAPATPGHILVIPRSHVSDIWSLGDDDSVHLTRSVLYLSKVIRLALLPDGLNLIQSNGDAATQSVGHLHVHLVPRWADDDMRLSWPDGSLPAEKIDGALARILAVESEFPGPWPEPIAEDRRKHLDHIQAVIARMSAASSAAKGWLLPVVVAAYGYAATKGAYGVALVGITAVLLFSYLDANYLRTERQFRDLYRTTGQSLKPLPPYTLDPADMYPGIGQDGSETPNCGAQLARVKGWFPAWEVWRSWSILPFYGALVIVGVIIAFAGAGRATASHSLPGATSPAASATVPTVAGPSTSSSASVVQEEDPSRMPTP